MGGCFCTDSPLDRCHGISEGIKPKLGRRELGKQQKIIV
jgi:hypothetical protein